MDQRWVLGVLVALGVAGCGGTDPVEGSLSASAVACTVAENSNSCSIAVTWSSQHAADLSLQAMPEGARQVTTVGTAPVSVTVRGTTVVLASGGLALATLSLTATCAGETEADELGYCLAKQLRYADKVYAEYNYPRVVTAERATRIANRTRYPDDQYRIDNCRLKPAPDPSGRIGVSCAVTAVANGSPSASSITRKFYIDPVADVLRDGEEGEPVAGDYGPGTRPAIPPDLAPYYRSTTFLDPRFEFVSGMFVVLDNAPYTYWTSVAGGHFLSEAQRGSLYFVARGTASARPLSDDLERVICRTCTLFPIKVLTYAN